MEHEHIYLIQAAIPKKAAIAISLTMIALRRRRPIFFEDFEGLQGAEMKPFVAIGFEEGETTNKEAVPPVVFPDDKPLNINSSQSVWKHLFQVLKRVYNKKLANPNFAK